MRKLIIIYVVFLFTLYGQDVPKYITQPLQCSTCHECEVPTKNNPCLRECPRQYFITVEHSAKEAPEMITIDRFKAIENHYMPVHFTHKLHAEMSNLSGGCQTCHHYNPPGRILTCTECHEKNRQREDISKPDLKGAYHRQCIGCHQKWNPEYNCQECHLEIGNKEMTEKAVPTEIKKNAHPKIEKPNKLVYKTDMEDGPIVTFLHSEHVNLFNIDCSNCHSDESCVKCHDRNKDKKAAPANMNLHDKCSKCHDVEDNCSFCHSTKEKEGFNHLARTGWELKNQHKKLDCIECHKIKGKFSKLDTKCVSCHDNWTPENFDHKVTGLILDEIHVENECEDCHVGNNYQSPTCENCHDEDIKFSKDVPGSYTK